MLEVRSRSLDEWLEFANSIHDKAWDFGLERMHEMVRRLDLSRPGKQILTIAGTNGKGSTCRACEALLLSAGYSVGLTMSPHIQRFSERIRIDGNELDEQSICAGFERVEHVRGDYSLSYFEFTSLVAMDCFRHANVDVAILEIGLGGRLDAFNAVDADFAVITSIDFDHQDYLGDTLELIGAEKAGILRRGQGVVLGPDMPKSVLDRCAELGLVASIYDEGFTASIQRGPVPRWQYHCADFVSEPFPLGSIAPQNLAVAMRTVQTMGVSTEQLSSLSDLQIEGRLQMHTIDDRTLILDVAHNPAGAQFLAEQIQLRGLHPTVAICGMLKDKPHSDVCQTIEAAFSPAWCLIDTKGWRQFSAPALQQSAELSQASTHDSIEAAWQYALSASTPGDVILAFGSFNAVEQCQSLVEN